MAEVLFADEAHEPVHSQAKVVKLRGAFPPGQAYPAREVTVREELLNSFRQGRAIARRHDEAGDSVNHRFPTAANIGRHHRQTGAHGLDYGARKSLTIGRQDEDVHQRQIVGDVIGQAGEHEVAGQAGDPHAFVKGRPELVAIARQAVTHDQEPGLAARVAQRYSHVEELAEALLLDDARHDADQRSVGWNPQRDFVGRHEHTRAGRKHRQVYSVMDGDGGNTATDNSGTQRGLPVFFRNEDKPIGQTAEQPFDSGQDFAPKPGRVVVEIEPVNHVGRIGAAHKQAGDARHGGRDRTVEVNGVEASRALQAHQLEGWPDVGEGIERPLHVHGMQVKPFALEPLEEDSRRTGDVDLVSRACEAVQIRPQEKPGHGIDSCDHENAPHQSPQT